MTRSHLEASLNSRSFHSIKRITDSMSVKDYSVWYCDICGEGTPYKLYQINVIEGGIVHCPGCLCWQCIIKTFRRKGIEIPEPEVSKWQMQLDEY